MIDYDLPVWNGVNDSPLIQTAPLRIDYTDYIGLYKQINKRIISYDQDYKHMTPLEGSDYIQNLRKGKIDWVLAHSNQYKKILEIGGGDCFNHPYFVCDNYTIIDPALKLKQDSDNLILIPEYFSDVNLNEKYDAILILSVLEHVDDVEKLIEKCAGILNDKGSIFVSIPIVDKRFAIGDFNVLVHEHISYFTFCGAQELFMQYGLSIQSFYTKNDSGYFRLIKDKKISKFFSYSFPNYLNIVKDNFNFQLDKFISLLKNDERIIFIGATNGLNNLLYLANKEINIDYEKHRITDSDKSKWGKFIGSHPLPILPINSIDHYNTVCISALSFFDEISSNIDKSKIIISTGFL